MIRHAIRCLVLCPLALGCGAPGGPTTDSPVTQEQPVAPKDMDRDRPARAKRSFAGTLRGGIVAVGAETTGWVLQSDELGRVDVDVSKAADAAGELDGKRVVVEGDLVTTHWPERGEKQLLVADAIRPADEGDGTAPADDARR